MVGFRVPKGFPVLQCWVVRFLGKGWVQNSDLDLRGPLSCGVGGAGRKPLERRERSSGVLPSCPAGRVVEAKASLRSLPRVTRS